MHKDTPIQIQNLKDRKDLTTEGAYGIASEILDNKLPPDQVAAVLTLLHDKEESVGEIVGFVLGVRERMLHVKGLEDSLDVCGTGGDGSGTFNISTAVAFVVAGAGERVVKHGNKAASSRCGSADVLEALGVNIHLDPAQAKQVAHDVGMVFLFAQDFHPAFANFATVRRSLNFRTIFNLIGPLANPARVTHQLVGVPTLEIARKLAEVAKYLSYENITFVVGKDGLDEVSTGANTVVITVKGRNSTESIIDPTEYGFYCDQKDALQGGDAMQNADTIRRILAREQGPKRDIVVLNSAVALVVSGKVQTIEEGIVLAQKSIDNGDALRILENLIKETRKYGKIL